MIDYQEGLSVSLSVSSATWKSVQEPEATVWPKKVELFDSYGNKSAFYQDPLSKYASRFSRVMFNPLVLQTHVTADCEQY